ncbi:hypothetical protein P9Z80_13810 [Bacillus cereus]|nr:hypothetical protein [Bacillus cereus]MEC3261981.1 hypothetical protein [Bacillus cereus]
MKGNAGYEPGKGRTFTPSTDAKWTDEFNQMISELGVSRNKLTEKLIEDGLRINRNSGSYIPLSTENLSQEQIEVLSSKMGQEILLNLAFSMLGGKLDFQANIDQKVNDTQVSSKVINESDHTSKKEVEVPISQPEDSNKENTEPTKPKNTAQMKALAKYKNMKKGLKN